MHSKDQRQKLERWKESAKMTKRDIFSLPTIKNNPLSVILIRKFTENEKLKTEEMIDALFTFVNSKSLDSKLSFIFEVYDSDDDGYISCMELFEILKALNKGILEDWKLQNIVDKTFAEFNEYKDRMNFDEFKALIAKRSKNLEVMFDCEW